MKSFSQLCACVALAWVASASQAGRPLATDDASTTPVGRCQLESWLEHRRRERDWVLAPACGLAVGLELGADYTLLRPRDTVRSAAGLSVKWAAVGWTLPTAAGEWTFGLKAGLAFENRVSEDRLFKRPFSSQNTPRNTPAELSDTNPSGCCARHQPVEH